jgi:hypothetical protein
MMNDYTTFVGGKEAGMNASHNAGDSVDPQLVEYVVVVVPDAPSAEVVLGSVSQLERDGLVTILDAALVAHDGAETSFADPFELLLDRTTYRPLLTEHDLRLVAGAVEIGQLGVVIVLEDIWATPLATTARAVGGYVAGGERIPVGRLRTISSPQWTSQVR